jgi:hypothetical protein
MGIDNAGHYCLTDEDKQMIGRVLIIANQRLVDIRGYVQQVLHGYHGYVEQSIEKDLGEVQESLKLIQNIPTCGDMNSFIERGRILAEAMSKNTGKYTSFP